MNFFFFFTGFFFTLIYLNMMKVLDAKSFYKGASLLLIIEFFSCVMSFIDIQSTGVVTVFDFGSMVNDSSNVDLGLVFVMDPISSTFQSLLSLIVVICLLFLGLYFEYDSRSILISVLSVSFTQLAYLFFCSYDSVLILCLWEVISLISFFLIHYWSFRIHSIKASAKVFTISQMGDLFFFFFFFLLVDFCESTSIESVHGIADLSTFFFFEFRAFGLSFSFFMGVLLISALVLKSAQFFFFPWLLDAMEAPVPISAQLHSSTLVIIGFYVAYRFNDFFFTMKEIEFVMFFFSFLSIMGASILGFFQWDGKKLLACSTASQLGYVLIGMSCGLLNESLVLLTFCCCNKAIIFIWFGRVMALNLGSSDLRNLGLIKVDFLTKAGLVVSVCCSTIAPGSFNWHIKVLLYRGCLSMDHGFYDSCVNVLSVTWFMSSLYLFKFFSYVFTASRYKSWIPMHPNYWFNYGWVMNMKITKLDTFFCVLTFIFNIMLLSFTFLNFTFFEPVQVLRF